MAKRRQRKKFRKYLRGQIDLSIDLGTLASNTGLKTPVGDTVVENTWCTSILATYSIGNVTPAAGVGPILMLLCHSDYTLVEVEEWIEATNSWNVGDLVAQEVAKRKIRRIGYLGELAVQASELVTMNDGMPVRTKCGWMLNSAAGLAFVSYNMGSAAFTTTDPDIEISGHANLWPR